MKGKSTSKAEEGDVGDAPEKSERKRSPTNPRTFYWLWEILEDPEVQEEIRQAERVRHLTRAAQYYLGVFDERK